MVAAFQRHISTYHAPDSTGTEDFAASGRFFNCMLRAAWICGLLSTHDYHLRVRQRRFGPRAVRGNDSALAPMEKLLFEDRLAIVLFLVAVGILGYTLLNAPAFQ